MTAPTAATVFAGSVAAQGQLDSNPLVEGDDDQAFRLAYRACRRLSDEPHNPSLLIDLGVAAFLRNRAEDDGMSRLLRGATFAGNYAISTAIHIRYPRIGQGESTLAIHAARIRSSDAFDVAAAEKVARALEAWQDGMDGRQAALAVADRLDALYTKLGMPTRLRQREDSAGGFPQDCRRHREKLQRECRGSLTGEPSCQRASASRSRLLRRRKRARWQD